MNGIIKVIINSLSFPQSYPVLSTRVLQAPEPEPVRDPCLLRTSPQLRLLQPRQLLLTTRKATPPVTMSGVPGTRPSHPTLTLSSLSRLSCQRRINSWHWVEFTAILQRHIRTIEQQTKDGRYDTVFKLRTFGTTEPISFSELMTLISLTKYGP